MKKEEKNRIERILNAEKINDWFEKFGKKIIAHRWLYVFSFIVLLGLSIFGMSKMRTNPSMENWFLEDDPITIATKKFQNIFGNDDYAGVLVTCDDVFSTENLKLIRKLCEELTDSVDFTDKVTSITNVEFAHGTESGMAIDQIIPAVIPTSKDSLELLRKKAFSKENFSSRLLTKDSKQTFVLLKFKPFPVDWKSKYNKMPSMVAGSAVMHVIGKKEYQPLKPKATGMPVVNNEITIAMGKETSKIMTIALSIAFLILLLVVRSFTGIVIPLITSVSSIIVVLGILGLTGYEFEPTLVTMPAVLGIAVSIGYSIHFFNFYNRQLLISGNKHEAILVAMKETGWPILFTALTTMAGLLSFSCIPLEFLWFIGISCALVVGVSYIIIITLTPALLSFGKTKKIKVRKLSGAFQNYIESKMSNIGDWVNKRATPIIIIWSILVIASFIGMTKIEVTSDHERTYGRKLECIDMFLNVAESELGSLYSYNLTIEFPKEGMAKEPVNLKNLDILSKEVQQYELTKRTSSINDYIKDMHQVLNQDNPTFYTVPESKEQVAQLLYLYENAGGSETEYWVDYEYKFLRLMVEVKKLDTKISIMENKKIVARAQELFPEARVSVVGTLAQSMQMVDYLLKGQIASFFVSVLVIVILLTIVFGGIKVGFIGLIPNIIPAFVVGGLMGFLHITLDMMTITIIPMLIGLAVDDTIHFINHGKLTFQKTGNYSITIRHTFKTIGVALLFTSFILSINFLIYTTSKVNMLVNMGGLAAAGILSALITELFITPILIKRFKVFGKETNKN